MSSRWVPESEVKARLAELGVGVPRGRLAEDADAALAAAEDLASPLVVKLSSPDLVHKSEIGGVVLGIGTPSELADAAASLLAKAQAAGLEGARLLVEEQSPAGVELFVGAIADENFGPVVTVGLGGIWVEAIDDVATALAPIAAADVERMLSGLRAWPMLSGGRGRRPVDLPALTALVMAVAGPDGIALEPGFEELDLNPVIARPDGLSVVDGRLRVGDAAPSAPTRVNGNFDRLFAPRAVAMIGASTTDSSKLSNLVLRASRDAGSAKRLVCIHPAAAKGVEAIDGVPCVAGLDAVDGELDVLALAVSAKAIPEILRNAEGRAPFAQIIASPPEDSIERAELNAALLDVARMTGIRVLGPSSLGTHSPEGGTAWLLNVSTAPGTVSVLTQSGGFGGNLLCLGEAERVRFAKVAAIGDAIDVGPAELLAYLLRDDDTRVIAMHLETARDARRLYDEIVTAPEHKPIVILKAARTEAGGRAAESHTGALAGDPRLWGTFERQAGVTIASSLQELVAAMKFFERHRDNLTETAPSALLLGGGGGFGVMGADALSARGIALDPLEPETRRRLTELLGRPVGETYDNPLDVFGPHRYESILHTVREIQRISDVVLHMRIDVNYVGTADPDAAVERYVEAIATLPAAFPDVRFSVALMASKKRADVVQQMADRLIDTPIALFDSFEDVASGITAATIHARRWSPQP